MRKIILITFFILTITQKAFCQSKEKAYLLYKAKVMDSLMQVLQVAHEDTGKVNILNYISKQLWIDGNFNKSMQYANEAILLGKKIKFDRGVASAYNNIGIINVEQANYAEALKNYQIALKMRDEIGDKEASSETYIDIGNAYIEQGDYPQALKNYLIGLKLGEDVNNEGIIANAYGSIASVYAQQGNYQEALKNNFLALKLRKSWNDINGMLLSYINIGSIYAKQGNYSEALKNFMSSAALSEKLEDKRNMYGSYGNIGYVYMLMGNYKEALKYHLMALKTEEEMGAKYSIADTYINLGRIYGKIKKEGDAKDYLQKGLQLAEENGSKDEIKDAYQALSEFDSLTGNMAAAYLHYRLYAEMKDSILNNESNKQISKLKIQYESDRKDHQIKTQALQLNAQDLRLQNKTLQNKIFQTRVYYGIAISLIFALFFFIRNKRKRKEYENKVMNLELKALKSQLKPHFIFNSLVSIKTYIDANPLAGTQYLNRFSILMRGILESSEEKEISLSEEMQLMEHYIELEKLCLSHKLNYSINYSPFFNADEIMIPPLITQPIIENAIQYGLKPKDKNKELNIYNVIAENTLIITIISNALKDDSANIRLNKKKSFGVKITRERLSLLRQMNGEPGNLNIDILQGQTKVEIIIPLKKVR